MKETILKKAEKVARENPFKVIMVNESPTDSWYLLIGDSIINPTEWKDKVLCTNIKLEDRPEQNLRSRLEDMKDDYKNLTGTDGSKVDWNPIKIE